MFWVLQPTTLLSYGSLSPLNLIPSKQQFSKKALFTHCQRNEQRTDKLVASSWNTTKHLAVKKQIFPSGVDWDRKQSLNENE